MSARAVADRLLEGQELSSDEFQELIENRTPALAERLADGAHKLCAQIYGDEVFTRGLIEFTNYCKNDCYYCGIRRSNGEVRRYRLTPEEILECADEGYDLGFRTFVLQGGEDPFVTDEWLSPILQSIKKAHPDCAITLSLGERSGESYRRLKEAGADRYLLRHETASPNHYKKLHPSSMSLESRLECIKQLRDLDYTVGIGFMVGSPYQTSADLAQDLTLIQTFKPEMCGIGPFVPHHATPFGDHPQGTVELTCFLLSIIRLIHPHVLLPATTALGTIDPQGREKAIEAGANVVMPNLSPRRVRKDYELYDNKICTGEEAAECRGCLAARMLTVGKRIVVDRGDPR